MPKTRGAETRQACSRFTAVNSREFVRNSHEFARISYEFHVNSREFIPISPLCTPSFVLTPGVPPPQTPLQAPWLQATCAHVCACAFVWGVWVCVGLCMVVWLGLHVGGCVTSCLFLRAGVRLCVGVCEDVGATRPHTHTNPSQTSHQHPHTHTHNHGPMDTHPHTNTHPRAQTNQHTHTHTHIDTPTMIPPHTPNHDTSTMQVCVRMCGWAVCGCGWGGRAV